MIFFAFAEGSVQLVPDGTIFFHIALILVMIWVLNRTLFKPINRILEARAGQTGGRSGEARQILQEVDQKLSSYETSIREARAESFRAVEETRRTAVTNRQQQIDAVKEEAASLIEAEKADLNTQIARTRGELKTEARAIAERIGSQVLRRPLNN